MEKPKVVEDLGLAKVIREIDMEFELHYHENNPHEKPTYVLTQVQKFQRRYKDKMFYKEGGR